jgi:hypothetical protein
MTTYKKHLYYWYRCFFVFLVTILGIALPQLSKADFVYSASYQKAMREILSLRLENGRQIIEQAKKTEPNNKLLPLAEDYIDFFTILINENEKEYDKLKDNKSKRISTINEGDKNSPWYNYAKAEIYMHWATNRIRFGDYFKAASELREAYKLLEENIKQHPNFLPNKKTMGMLETLVGTVPSNYQWVVNIIGMDGDIESGMQKVEEVINSKSNESYIQQQKQEALFIYVYLQMYVVKKPQEAWNMVMQYTKDYKTNLLNCYLRANIALRSKKTNEAITVLLNRPRGDEYHKFYYLDYLLGKAKLYRGDKNAHTYFKVYVSFHPGKNFIKGAYMHLSWFYFLEGNQKKYQVYKSMASSYGAEKVEEDKKAMKYAQETTPPDKTLLTTTLNFDGGYLTKALNALNAKSVNSYSDPEKQLEYYYRKARILHEQGNTNKAVDLYKKVIKQGQQSTSYFAANSSLMLGSIYEDIGLKTTACNYYKKCSTFPNKQYKNSIRQKAKAGQKRLGCS